MYYEVYMDVLFLQNFMMDSLLLLSVRRILKCPVSVGRVFFGGGCGAVLTCLFVILPVPGIVKMPILYIFPAVFMTIVGLKLRDGQSMIKAFTALAAATFFAGGILEALRPWIKQGALFFAAAAGAYYVLYGIWVFLTKLQKRQKNLCCAELAVNGKTVMLSALVDTGNGLKDPLSKEAVHVLDCEVYAEKFGEKDFADSASQIKWWYIPYRTVNGSGIMQVFRADEMKVYTEGNKKQQYIEKPLIGISGEAISRTSEYQLILNEEIADNWEEET